MKGNALRSLKSAAFALVLITATMAAGQTDTPTGPGVPQPDSTQLGPAQVVAAAVGGFSGGSFCSAGPAPGEGLTDLSAGVLRVSQTDFYLPGPLPIVLTRVYRTRCLDDNSNWLSFDYGMGMEANYNLRLISISNRLGNGYRNVQVVMPDGGQLWCDRSNACGNGGCTDYQNAIFTCESNPDLTWFGSTITYSSTIAGWVLVRKDGTKLTFPSGQPLMTITDRNGNVITLTRDANDNLTKITDSNGRTVTLLYTDADNPNQIISAFDNSSPQRFVQYDYDNKHRMISVTDHAGKMTTFGWGAAGSPDTTGDILNVTDPISRNGTATFDSSGRLKTAKGVLGPNFSLTYTTQAGVGITSVEITDPDGHVRHLDYNADGYVTRDIKAKGETEQQITTYGRDTTTNLILSETDPLNRLTNYTYDGNNANITDANITAVARAVGTVDAATTTFAYDSNFARLIRVTDPLGHSWTAAPPDAEGNITSVSDPLGNTTIATYNAAGQMKTIKDPAQNIYSYGYNTAGDLTSMTDALGRTSTFTPDTAGRITQMVDPLRNKTIFGYDGMDRVTQITDPNGGITKYEYDAAGEVSKVTDPNTHSTTYGYDWSHGIVTRCDAVSRCVTYSVNALGQVTSSCIGYLCMGLSSALTNTYDYDGIGRLDSIVYNSSNLAGFDKTTTTYTYDGGNRLTKAVDSGTSSTADTIIRGYDNLNDLKSEAYTAPGLSTTTSYTYDKARRRQTMTVTGQAQTVYAFDNANRLTSVTRGAQTVTIIPDADVRRSQVQLPSGGVVNYSYDGDSHVTFITYNSVGFGGSLLYGYDANGRVVSLNGSRAGTQIPDPMTATYDNSNQLAIWNSVTATSDSRGNLTYDPSNAATYAWNERNQLASAAAGSGTSSFKYDALGRRVSVTPAGGVSTQFAYDGQNVAREISAGGNADLLAGMALDDWFSRTQGSVTSTFMRNANNSTIALRNTDGTVPATFGYEPFGTTTTTGSTTSSYAFTGREQDATGLYFMRNRYYNPMLQRFLSPDPIGYDGGSIDLYAYVDNDPLNWTDPIGLKGGGGGGGGGGGWPPDPDPPPAPPPPPPPAPPAPPSGFYYGLGQGVVGDRPAFVDVRFISPFLRLPDNPNDSPGPGWVKRGPNWFNPQTGQSLHPDLQHPAPEGPHWDLHNRKPKDSLRLRSRSSLLEFWNELTSQWQVIETLPLDLLP
jgi:RHS repeat-associated protein